jgi:Tfp pilus assembly protein PilF
MTVQAAPQLDQDSRLREATAIGNRGLALLTESRPAEALAAFREALVLLPENPSLLYNCGVALQALGRFEDAITAYDAALARSPRFVPGLINKAAALIQLDRAEEALQACRTALVHQPGNVEAQCNAGQGFMSLGRYHEAELIFRDILARVPDFDLVQVNLAHTLLVTGRMAEGWPHYEKRLGLGTARQAFEAALWRGAALDGRTLLVHADQGFGDTLQFCRYLPLLPQDGKVVVEVQPALAGLLRRTAWGAAVVAQGERLPPFDLHIPMMSLPGVLGTVLETIPGRTPYLTADPVRSAAWRRRLAALPRLKVGLVWGGNSLLGQDMFLDRKRSVPLAALAPLAAVGGVGFVSLQKGAPAAQAAMPPAGLALQDFTAELADFDDTAALVEALDLVISVDTSVVHLAGALGKPIWLLNRSNTCWRWLLDREDSPWYPTMRLFRQTKTRDYAEMAGRIRTELLELIATRRALAPR